LCHCGECRTPQVGCFEQHSFGNRGEPL
jgi:hypothetical protein